MFQQVCPLRESVCVFLWIFQKILTTFGFDFPDVFLRTVVFNQRGNGGINLTTPRLYSAANTEDLKEVLEVVCGRFPTATVSALGISLGG